MNADKKCAPEYLERVSVSYTELIKKGTDLGEVTREKIALLKGIAEKHGLKQYRLTSHSVGVNRSSFGTDMLDLQMYLEIEFAPDLDAMTALVKEAGAANVSSSVTWMPDDLE